MDKVFTHCTHEVRNFDGVDVNTSLTKVWIKQDPDSWRQLFKHWRDQSHLDRREVAKYKMAGASAAPVSGTRSKTSVCSLYSSWRRKAIYQLSELESLSDVCFFFDQLVEAKSETQGRSTALRSGQAIRKFLSDALDRNLVLLPMTRRGQLSWFPYSPSIRRKSDLAAAVERALSSWEDTRLLAASASFFNHVGMTNASQLTEKFCQAYYESPFQQRLPTNRTSLYNKTLEAIANIARHEDPNFLPPAVSRAAYVSKRKLTDTDFWWLTDVSAGGAPEWKNWQDWAINWVYSLKDKKLDTKVNSITYFIKFCQYYSIDLFDPLDVRRKHVAEVSYSDEPNFFSWLESNVGQEPSYKTVVGLYQFFEYVDNVERYNEDRASFVNPFQEADASRFASGPSRRGKSNKDPLPSEIIQMAIEVLTEDEFRFSKTFKSQYVRSLSKETGLLEDVWCPVVTTALLTLLTLPIRTLQACLLDSGEADEFLITADGHVKENPHPLARVGREMACIRAFPSRLGSEPFVGFFINTNKTAENSTNEFEIGYEIPWNEERLLRQMGLLREWQIQYNPIPVMLTRGQLEDKSQRVNSTVINQPEYTFLFRDATHYGNKMLPITGAKITQFWGHVCLAVQDRLDKLGYSIQLVRWKNAGRRSEPHALYTLHSLRVSGITNFIENGVPIHVISEFVSGHAQLIMTLYYTKLNPGAVRDKLELAYDKMRSVSEDDFFDTLAEMSGRFIENKSEGSPGKRALLAGERGFWSFDIDGVCPVGRSSCSTGRLIDHSINGKPVFGPIVPDGFNCPQCRFWLTGPDFLVGQAAMFNNLLYVIRERTADREKIIEKIDGQFASKNPRKAKLLSDQLRKIEDELSDKVTSLGARLERFYASKKLKDEGDLSATAETKSHAMLTSMCEDELNFVIEETRSWELLEFAAQTFEFFPQVPVSSARFRKQLLLEQIAQQNGLAPLFLHLSVEDAQFAANKLTDLLTKLAGREALSSLMSGEQSLLELGIIDEFEVAVGEAIPTALEATKGLNPISVKQENPSNIYIDSEGSDIG